MSNRVMMEERNPFTAFDWDFADVSKRDAARYHAIKDKPKETSVLMDLVSANALIHFALWNELPEAHPVGELYMETETDLIATIYLAYGGFFRQALVVLRAWFEIAVHSVYFSKSKHYAQLSSRYKQWRRGQRNAPVDMGKVARALASRRDMIFKTDEATIHEKLEPIYSFLSEQIHAKGLDVYNLQEGRDNVPRYLSRSFDVWYKKVLEAFDALCFLYRIFFIREIASYFKDSETEMQHARALAESLSGVMPNFGCLMADVFAGRRSPDYGQGAN